jgi:opacity protein-like surface antigen
MKFIQEHRTDQTSLSNARRVAAMTALVAVALAFAPRWTAAQASDTDAQTGDTDAQPSYTAAQPSDVTEAPPEPPGQKPRGVGVALSIAGGISAFSRSSARDFLDTGGTWDVRGVFGTRTLFGLEAAYVGSANGLDGPGGLTRTLYGHGVEGDLRLNILRNGLAFAGGLQPYVLGGFGWTHYHLSENVATAAIDNSDDTLQVPVGAGVSYYFGKRVLVDARFTYRFAFSDNLIQGTSLDTMGVTARVGAEF